MANDPSRDYCDFCNDLHPVWMFRNPQILSRLLQVVYDAGHYSACEACAELKNAGRNVELVARVMDLEQAYVPFKGTPAWNRVFAEFLRIFTAISNDREPYPGKNEYHRQSRPYTPSGRPQG